MLIQEEIFLGGVAKYILGKLKHTIQDILDKTNDPSIKAKCVKELLYVEDLHWKVCNEIDREIEKVYSRIIEIKGSASDTHLVYT